MDGIFSDAAIERIKKIRKTFLWIAIGILILELVVGAVIILGQFFGLAVAKVYGVFTVIAAVLFVSINNFIRIEKGGMWEQITALVGLFANVITGILAILFILEAIPYYYYEEVEEWSMWQRSYFTKSIPHMTVIAKMFSVTYILAGAMFFISNTMATKETVKQVKILKIAALVCLIYCWIYYTIVALVEPINLGADRFQQLAGLLGFAYVVLAVIAVIISNANNKERKNKKQPQPVQPITNPINNPAPFVPKTDEELRMEIEEKIRREKIEKEVREKMGVPKTDVGSNGQTA